MQQRQTEMHSSVVECVRKYKVHIRKRNIVKWLHGYGLIWFSLPIEFHLVQTNWFDVPATRLTFRTYTTQSIWAVDRSGTCDPDENTLTRTWSFPRLMHSTLIQLFANQIAKKKMKQNAQQNTSNWIKAQ